MIKLLRSMRALPNHLVPGINGMVIMTHIKILVTISTLGSRNGMLKLNYRGCWGLIWICITIIFQMLFTMKNWGTNWI